MSWKRSVRVNRRFDEQRRLSPDVQSPYDAIVIVTSHNHLFLKIKDENTPLVICTMLEVFQINPQPKIE